MTRAAFLLAFLLAGCASAPDCETDSECAILCTVDDDSCDGGPADAFLPRSSEP